MIVRVQAFAKLNLFLEVCGPRTDGFHNIRSRVQTIDLADTLEIAPADEIHVVCDQALDGDNIVAQAVRMLLREKRSHAGVHIAIEKHIPIGAGLGGGSSDAAAALTTVNKLVPPAIPAPRIAEIAAKIGSDVPLFLQGGCMEIVGRGDPGMPLAIQPRFFVILAPPIHCSTREIFQAWDPQDKQAPPLVPGQNDLYPAAARIYPRLDQYREMMDCLGGLYAGMTGSGSAFFAAFDDQDTAHRAQRELTRHRPECRVYCCQPTAVGFAEQGD